MYQLFKNSELILTVETYEEARSAIKGKEYAVFMIVAPNGDKTIIDYYPDGYLQDPCHSGSW